MYPNDYHYFNVAVACECGTNAAIIFEHIKFLVKHNQAEGLKDAYVDGTWWAYGTVEGFSKLYPYMGKSSKPVRAAIDSLIDHGLIRREEHSSCHWDHTSWYCLTRKGAEACGYAPDGSEPEPQKRDCCEKPKVAGKYADECYEVIEYLRQVSGRKVEHCESNYRPIRSLLSDRNPATVEQMKLVIDSKSREWCNDPHFRKYLQPSTLFSKKHFMDYLLAAQESGARAERFEDGWHGDF